MPMKHQKYLSYNSDAFLSWAEGIGASTKAVVKSFLSEGREPEQGYKYCVSLMSTVDRYGQARVECACERVLAFSTVPSLRNIVTVLRNGQDKLPLNKDTKDCSPIDNGNRKKGITRGVDAFRMGGDGV